MWLDTKLFQQKPADVFAQVIFLLERCAGAAVRISEEHLNVPHFRFFLQQEPSWSGLAQNVNRRRRSLLLVPPGDVAASSSPDHASRHQIVCRCHITTKTQ